MEQDENKSAAIEKHLGEPIAYFYTEEMLKVRRNLLILAAVAVGYKMSGAKITGFDPLGFTVVGFKPEIVDQAFFVCLLYCLIHFLWFSADALLEWRLRLTGVRLSHQTGSVWGSGELDYPDDPRQSTLMNWWRQQQNRLNFTAERSGNLRNIERSLTEISQIISTADSQLNHSQMAELNRSMGEVHQRLCYIDQHLVSVEETLKSQRIPAALGRFESWFKLFGWSQLWRLMLLEFGLPVVLGLVGLTLVVPVELKGWISNLHQ